jgi:hypothetical protein
MVESKWLHAADLDFYLTLRPRSDGPVSVSFSPDPSVNLPEIAASMSRIPESTGTAHQIDRGVIAAAPNDNWQTAQLFELGQTIFGSDDERPYAPSKSEDAYAAMVKGFQWFRFTFREKQPRLVYFVLNVTDRDVPLDVDIFQLGKDSDGHPDAVPPAYCSRSMNTTFVWRRITPPINCTPISTACPPARIRTRLSARGWIFWSTWATAGSPTHHAVVQYRCALPCSTQRRNSASRVIRRSLLRVDI